MKGKKTFGIWAGVTVGLFVICMCVCFLIGKVILDTNLGYSKYASRAENLLKPETAEQSKLSAFLYLRVALGNSSFEVSEGESGLRKLVRFQLDKATIISTNSGDVEKSAGIWAMVLQSDSKESGIPKDGIGLVSVDQMCKEAYANRLYELLQQDPNIRIQLLEYGVKGTTIIPVKLQIRTREGDELEVLTGGILPEGYQLVQADSTYILNLYVKNEPYENGDKSMKEKMAVVFLGERKVDQLARKTVNSLSYGSEIEAKPKYGIGFGKYTLALGSVSGDYSFVMVNSVDFHSFFWALFFSLAGGWSILYWGIIGLMAIFKKTK